MFKKILATALLACTIPAVASASWFLSTQVRNAGGTLDSRNQTAQSVADGALFRSYTTSAGIPITVTAADGYSIRSVTVNGVTAAAPASPYTVTIPGDAAADKTVTASFIVNSLKVGASVTGGGYVTPASLGNISYGTVLSKAVTFNFMPTAGYTITGITGIPNDPLVTSSIPNVAGRRATVTFPAGYKFTGNIDLRADSQNSAPSINRVLPQTVTFGSQVNLTANVNNIASPTFTWTYVSGPANTATYNGPKIIMVPGPAITLYNANAANTSFTAPSVAGQYKFLVTEGTTGEITLATVNVIASNADAANQCQFCHSANNIGSQTISADWRSSQHQAKGVLCATCHTGADSGAHPGQVVDCVFCHTKDGRAATPVHTAANAGDCSTCHTINQHSAIKTVGGTVDEEHVSGSATQAEYVVPTASCSDCHSDGSNPPSKALLADFAGSGHGNVKSSPWFGLGFYDFKNTNHFGDVSCQRCHTSTGFINFQNSGYHQPTTLWGNPNDHTKQTLSCVACHSNSNDFANSVRNAGAYTAPYGTYSTAASFNYVQYPDVAKSNVCIPCHAGQMNESFAANADPANTHFGDVAPHYLAAAGILNSKVGFKFYTSAAKYVPTPAANHFLHNQIGVNNFKADLFPAPFKETGYNGPCVSCHMQDGTHTLKVTQGYTDRNNGICTACHLLYSPYEMSDAKIEECKENLKASLDFFKAVLADKSIPFLGDYPYFGITDWTAVGPAGGTGTQNLGAAFNFMLLLKEPGAFAHNQTYTKRLIYDSIEYLQNGTVTGAPLNFTNLSSATVPVSKARAYLSDNNVPGKRP